MKKSTWLHLRIPFSFFLLPVFLFALAISPQYSINTAWAMLVILHLFLYPASNGYNSYFDKDEQSIGGLKHPPPVSKELYFVALILDVVAIFWGFFIKWEVALMLFIYGLISKAYSHPKVRLKKFPILGWLAAGIFQGAFTFVMVYIAVHPTVSTSVVFPATLATLLLWGSYPMTQVYQHEEDSNRGDLTLSRLLGVRGTFVFTALVFLLANAGFLFYFWKIHSLNLAMWFQLALLPVLGYFGWWMYLVWNDAGQANFDHTMRLNFLSSLCLNVFFLSWLLL